MICDTGMLKIAYYSLLLNFQRYRSPSAKNIVVSRNHKKKAAKREKIKLIFLSRFLNKRKKNEQESASEEDGKQKGEAKKKNRIARISP